MSTIRQAREMPHPPVAIWETLFDPAAARGWLGVAGFIMPEREGAAFCWFFDAGPTLPSAEVGRILELERPRRLSLLLHLSQSGTDSTVTIELTPLDEQRTEVVVWHMGFREDGLGPFERDGWEHCWEHHLDLLTDHLAGTPNNYQIGHRAVLGVVPVGVAAGKGLLVAKVRTGSPVDTAGVRTGDVIRAADQHVFDSMEDFDTWIDTREPGERVVLRIGDRALPAVLEAKQPPEYLAIA